MAAAAGRAGKAAVSVAQSALRGWARGQLKSGRDPFSAPIDRRLAEVEAAAERAAGQGIASPAGAVRWVASAAPRVELVQQQFPAHCDCEFDPSPKVSELSEETRIYTCYRCDRKPLDTRLGRRLKRAGLVARSTPPASRTSSAEGARRSQSRGRRTSRATSREGARRSRSRGRPATAATPFEQLLLQRYAASLRKATRGRSETRGRSRGHSQGGGMTRRRSGHSRSRKN